MKSFTDEMEARVVSKRGPYDLFTGERNKPISVGYFALPVSLYNDFFLGRCLLLLLRIRFTHLEILGFPMGGAY